LFNIRVRRAIHPNIIGFDSPPGIPGLGGRDGQQMENGLVAFAADDSTDVGPQQWQTPDRFPSISQLGMMSEE